MKGKTEIIAFKDSFFQYPINYANITFYNYPATITDSTVNGTIAVDTTGSQITGVLLNDRMGQYKFENIPAGYYTVVISGVGIKTFIPQGFDKYEVLLSSQITGTDIPYKDNSSESIAKKIDDILEILDGLV